jgi:hypothetical protein
MVWFGYKVFSNTWKYHSETPCIAIFNKQKNKTKQNKAKQNKTKVFSKDSPVKVLLHNEAMFRGDWITSHISVG